MTERAELEAVIFRAIARNGPAKQAAAVLDAIQADHVILDRARMLAIVETAADQWGEADPTVIALRRDLDPAPDAETERNNT